MLGHKTAREQRRQEATALLLSAVVHAGVLCLPVASLLEAERTEEPLAVRLDLQGETRSAAAEETGTGFSARDPRRSAGSEAAGPVEEPPDSSPKQAESLPREDRGPAPPGVPEPEAVPAVAEGLEALPQMPDPAPQVEEMDPQQPELDSEADRRSGELESAVGSPATSTVDEGERAAGSEPETVSHGGAGGRSEAPETGRGKRRGKRQAEESELLPAHLLAPKPPYPARSRDLGEEGIVIIAILVGEDGRVVECRVASSSGHPLLDGSALSTVRQRWRFKAGRKAGKPVASWVRVPVEFRITKR